MRKAILIFCLVFIPGCAAAAILRHNMLPADFRDLLLALLLAISISAINCLVQKLLDDDH